MDAYSMDVQILASILGGLVAGLFTFLGVLITILYEKRKDTKRELIRLKEKEDELVKQRPRLEIQEYFPLSKDRVFDADLEIILGRIMNFKDEGRACFEYHKDLVNKEKWVSVDYIFKNTGVTEIDHIYLMTNLPKNTSIFNISSGEYISDFKNIFLNYSVILEKNVKSQQTLKIRVNYIDDHIIESNIGSATITIWIIDINKNIWTQPLFAPDNKIYNSEKSSFEKFRMENDIETAIKCFRDPVLW